MKIILDGRVVRMSGFGKNRSSVPREARKSPAAEWNDDKTASYRSEFASLYAMLDELPDHVWAIP
jgi:hypothetical protein